QIMAERSPTQYPEDMDRESLTTFP
ncbi:uncharacterized protein METZ01_LOCUS84468, partial [marine metagenome]